ncbi:recombinase family protein [Clostridium pasteurianum]|uniref:Site-specific recombinase, DNA invertase Pin n=1 Tax=Clostridium pasteurianum BC1 TaxID=86416 RepID=R4K4L8_CLOPA|nr:recombinase family protein [Clostridium pasteurianum]AGK96666.1 site-specific recombinase, DNA invertase Pin [Clostridium pasteurianum BC1]
MKNKIFAYIRVSSKDQNTDRQMDAINEYCKSNDINLDERDIYTDKASGKNFNREKYQALKINFREGDTLIIKELDRLGRDMVMIKEEWHELTKSHINIVVIDTPILNTTNKTDLEKSLISNIVFELLAYMAQKERLKIKQRQSEGIAAARAKGKHLGRPKAEYPSNWNEVIPKWENGEITAVEAMKFLNLKKNTFYKLTKKLRNEKRNKEIKKLLS